MGTRSHTTATKAALALGIFLTPLANLSFKPPAFRAAPEGATNIGHEVSPRHRRALSAIDLTTHKSDGSLIDGSGIPCLNSREVGFSRLVSRAGAPAVGLEEIRR